MNLSCPWPANNKNQGRTVFDYTTKKKGSEDSGVQRRKPAVTRTVFTESL